MQQTAKTREVYGVNRDLPLNYVERKKVDDIFVNNLSRDKHVVIYGSSKQGKTSLRKHCLNDDDFIVISCLNTMTLADLHGAILKAAGYRIEQTSTKTIGGRTNYTAEFKGKGKVPLVLEAEGKASVSGEDASEDKKVYARLELDLHDVNDVITALEEIKFSDYVILEDFHYLPTDTQKNFAFALKAFHENAKICFIVIGVWREKNRLIYYNGDLSDRVVSIDVDEWSADELRQVISAGEALLNVQFDEQFSAAVINHAFDSVHLVQEACVRVCDLEGVSETLKQHRMVGVGSDAPALIKSIVNEQAGRYSAFIANFSEGFQTTGLEMYKWVLYSVVSSATQTLAKGLRRNEIATAIKKKHPQGTGLNEGNITQALQNIASLQVQKNVRPIILDYDQTTRVLNVVDRSFLIWLAYQDHHEILQEMGID